MKKIAIVLLTLLLIAGVLFGVCYWFGTHRDFVILHNGVTLDSLEKSLTASGAEPLVFEIQGNGDFEVKVVTYEKCEVTYFVADKPYVLKDFGDVTSAFNITKANSALTVAPKGSLESMISVVKNGATVKVDEKADLSQDLFTLIISGENKEYRVNFGLYTYDVNDVKLSDGKLVF